MNVLKSNYDTKIGNLESKIPKVVLYSKIKDLKSQHIADEVKKLILEREAIFFKGSDYFSQQAYSIYEPKTFSSKQTTAGIKHWKSTGI